MTSDFAASASGNQAHLLLAENHRASHSTVRRTLERYGFTVTTANDGRSTLEAMCEQSPDLILLDSTLAGLDGIEVCRRLRKQSRIPILMLSSYSNASDVVRSLEAGADDYVDQPCEGSVLVARIRALLRRTGLAPDEFLPLYESSPGWCERPDSPAGRR
ncbi:response regulator transcription factor [Streptomyces sp. AV19]|uniref:response regulator transcription factor n=1 Tax=Streptomyces sp. AV19 TaxID=2793068 RepID=UPI0018FE0546|nr:response regulator transcription factor [Streptomyces sp. AV19]MBH1938998.1 response regulator transcription factor [Streptomyces sp. AV19]MDG4536868.1 response regulator transcription factor [Streptomyces sp. AV19]